MVKSSTDIRRDRQIALVIGAGTVGLLLRSVPFDLLPGDPGEFQFAAWNFGLAHATGYPLYLILGGVWQHLWALAGISPAAALNLLSAIFAGAAAGLLYLLLVDWLPGTDRVRPLAAALATAFFVVNPTLRSQALQAEVYTLHALLLVAILVAVRRFTAPAIAGAPEAYVRRFVWLALLLGLGLTHHATTLLLTPALLLYLFVWDRNWWRNRRMWLWGIPAGLAPLLLYLYVPLRSGPEASPWYHQRLGDGILTLYTNTLPAFVDFITGRSISVGFNSTEAALAGLPTAAVLWLRHFEWAGLVLIVVGLYVLIRVRNWPVLALTVSYFVLQQIFNLFYAIGDIFVYYIPLYLVACIWIGYAGAGIGSGFQLRKPATPADVQNASPQTRGQVWGALLLIILFALPAQLWLMYAPLFDQLRLDSDATRRQWEAILEGGAPGDAILVSNDRNEIVPLFYFQTVERRGVGHTGLFPLITPEERFSDIGATIQTALEAGGTQPVYLIKPMPGLETRFAMKEQTAPLVEITGPAAATPPVTPLDLPYGPLRLLGYTASQVENTVTIALYWSVAEPPSADYTTTVQLFDGSDQKVGQADSGPGGVFYPTSRWKVGETLVDRHTIELGTDATPVRMLVGMYAGPEATLLAQPLEITPVTVE